VDSWIVDRRAERNPVAAKNRSIIDAMTEGEDADAPSLNENEGAVDSIFR
jgi:hypothetical protein